jgi:uncharacterized protein
MTGNVADQSAAVPRQSLTRRKFLIGSSLAAGGLALYSAEIARHEISTVTQTLSLRNLPDAFHNFRIVQISDIHYDEYTEPFFVHRIIRHVNALQPDLVLLTGDFITFGPLPRDFGIYAMQQCAQALRAIVCPQRFAVMGNHDSFLGAPDIHPILAAVDVPLLVNQHVPIERDGQRLWLCGIHDPVTHVPDLEAAIPAHPDGPVLLMSHGPDYADELLTHPRGPLVDAMFSGHSHGGQVRFPFLPPMHLPAGGRKYIEGHYCFDRSTGLPVTQSASTGTLQLYVNRGIGTTGLPFRLNCPPEITLFTLQSA